MPGNALLLNLVHLAVVAGSEVPSSQLCEAPGCSTDQRGDDSVDLLQVQVEKGGQANKPGCFNTALSKALAKPQQWMTELTQECGQVFTNKRWTDILLPASHDAAAYGTASDQPFACSIIKCTEWFTTQLGNLRKQMNAGSRYFDLRLHWNAKLDGCSTKSGGGSANCWEAWHPPPKTRFLMTKVPGLNFARLIDILGDVKQFMDTGNASNAREVVILNLKLEQWSGHSGDKEGKNTRRMKFLHDLVWQQLGGYISSLDVGSKWWQEKVGSVSGSRGEGQVIVQIAAPKTEAELKTYGHSDFERRLYTGCKGHKKKCAHPLWKTGFAGQCCDVNDIVRDQLVKRKKFNSYIKNHVAINQADRPLISLSYQFTGPKVSSSLRIKTAKLKPQLLDFYNKIVDQDNVIGYNTGSEQRFPAANIMGMDFVEDCPQAGITAAVCGSLLPVGEKCLETVNCG